MFIGEGFDSFRLRLHVNSDQWLEQLKVVSVLPRYLSCHWHLNLLSSCLNTLPRVELFSKTQSEEAEKSIHIKVVCSLVSVPSFFRKHLFCLPWVVSMIDLPHAHQVVCLGAQCRELLTHKTDELFKVLHVEVQLQWALEIFSKRQPRCMVKGLPLGILVSCDRDYCRWTVSFNEILETVLDQVK